MATPPRPRGPRGSGSGPGPEPLKNLDRLAGLRANGLVGVRVGGDDRARDVDHEPRRHRQRPRGVAVVLRQVDPELQVELPQIVGHSKRQPELPGHLVALITQQVPPCPAPSRRDPSGLTSKVMATPPRRSACPPSEWRAAPTDTD